MLAAPSPFVDVTSGPDGWTVWLGDHRYADSMTRDVARACQLELQALAAAAGDMLDTAMIVNKCPGRLAATLATAPAGGGGR